ncbi:fimbrial protein [Serratia fonticola]|uniref:fimbrial protein n=1 Tax=Serratia fonticola TaxID=47917 RepID=UPI003AAA72C4
MNLEVIPMFNKSLLALVLAAASCSAFAAPIANLKIDGKVTPPTCTVNGADQADLVFDLGAVSPSLIPASGAGYNTLPVIQNTLTVLCDAATYLTFKATDTSSNAFIQPSGMNINFRSLQFRMVDASAPEKTVGSVAYGWSNVTADGVAAYISRANDGQDDNGTYATQALLVRNATNGWTKTSQQFVAPSALDLISAKEFKATFSNTLAGSSTGHALTSILPVNELTKQGIDISEGVDYTSNVMLAFSFGV